VSARLGIDPIPPISAKQLQLDPSRGGLIIAGSYVPKTTAQLEVLVKRSGDRLTTVVLDVEKLLKSPESAEAALEDALKTAEMEINKPHDILVMTSRKLIVGDDEVKSLDIGSIVAKVLVLFLQRLKSKPRYVIAKVRYLGAFTCINADLLLGGHHIFRYGHQRPQHEASRDRRSSCRRCPSLEMRRTNLQISRAAIRRVSGECRLERYFV
jgi:hypothetical protein